MSLDQPNGVGEHTLFEIHEFAKFSAREQRYIRRSIDIAQGKEEVFILCPRDIYEEASMREQKALYARLPELRAIMPAEFDRDMTEPFMAPLISLTVFDLTQGSIEHFKAYRFLYERLLGSLVRPWLPGTFCAAAALPAIAPEGREKLLRSISHAAATAPAWSKREPVFFPEWVDKAK